MVKAPKSTSGLIAGWANRPYHLCSHHGSSPAWRSLLDPVMSFHPSPRSTAAERSINVGSSVGDGTEAPAPRMNNQLCKGDSGVTRPFMLAESLVSDRIVPPTG